MAVRGRYVDVDVQSAVEVAGDEDVIHGTCAERGAAKDSYRGVGRAGRERVVLVVLVTTPTPSVGWRLSGCFPDKQALVFRSTDDIGTILTVNQQSMANVKEPFSRSDVRHTEERGIKHTHT
eukprot:TRINITY_DN5443_c0_g1_i1.p4 TRINITY_DN5443_c0_g1~~TRINITY_DN5443_c0_g1_i1.p4  ORF type:complete len:122 (-),score=1.53 TRINITY_DN5443_c0_g1_i1:2095-2460(-)